MGKHGYSSELSRFSFLESESSLLAVTASNSVKRSQDDSHAIPDASLSNNKARLLNKRFFYYNNYLLNTRLWSACESNFETEICHERMIRVIFSKGSMKAY